MKKVTIMFRNSYVGGDGWTYYPLTIEIGDNCPVCGCKRGEVKPINMCEDGEWFNVDTWHNECGHIDYYSQCYKEYLNLSNTPKDESL